MGKASQQQVHLQLQLWVRSFFKKLLLARFYNKALDYRDHRLLWHCIPCHPQRYCEKMQQERVCYLNSQQ